MGYLVKYKIDSKLKIKKQKVGYLHLQKKNSYKAVFFFSLLFHTLLQIPFDT